MMTLALVMQSLSTFSVVQSFINRLIAFGQNPDLEQLTGSAG